MSLSKPQEYDGYKDDGFYFYEDAAFERCETDAEI